MQILALAGIMMVNVIILSKIKIKIDDIMKASKNENTSVKVPSVICDLERTGKRRLILGIINFPNHLYLTEKFAV